MFRSLLTALAIDIKFNPNGFVENLRYMGEGMLCIFIVIGAIILTTVLLNKIMNKKK